MNLVHLAGVTPQPWRNGGGVTRELLAWPTPADWQLRVSVATVAQDGPFSPFPGVERWFAVVAGAGLVLGLPAGDVELQTTSAPLHFAGEAAPGCRLLHGATQDLNLMARRAGGVGHMRRAGIGSCADDAAAWRGLYAADALTLELDGAVMAVSAGTLLWLAGAQVVGWQVQTGAARAWWLSWRPR